MKLLLLSLVLITHSAYAEMLSDAKEFAFDEVQERSSNEFVKMSNYVESEAENSASVSFDLTDSLNRCTSNIEISCENHGGGFSICISEGEYCDGTKFKHQRKY